MTRLTEEQAREVLLALAEDLVGSGIGYDAEQIAWRVWRVAKVGRGGQVAELVQVLGRGVVEPVQVPGVRVPEDAWEQARAKAVRITEGQARLLLVRLRKNGWQGFDNQVQWLGEQGVKFPDHPFDQEDFVAELCEAVTRDDLVLLLRELPKE